MLYPLIGLACLTIIPILATILIRKRRKRKIQLNKIMFRQSVMFQAMKPILPTNSELRKEKDSQSKNYHEKSTIKVVISPDDKCYWVLNNTFYCAEIVDGFVDPDTTHAIKTDSLSKEEVNKLLEILDTLRKE